MCVYYVTSHLYIHQFTKLYIDIAYSKYMFNTKGEFTHVCGRRKFIAVSTQSNDTCTIIKMLFNPG